MIVVSVMYESGKDFDETYYLTHHMPLVRARWNGLLTGARVLKGIGSADDDKPAYQIVAELSFPSTAELQQAMGGPHTSEIMGDIPNFTGIEPTLMISEVIG